MIDFINGPLAPLAAYRQFIVWQMRQVTEAGRAVWKKYPTDYRKLDNPRWSEQIANAHDPAIWLSAAEAQSLAALAGRPYGFGFSLTAADPFIFIDLDKCYDATTRQWKPEALAVLQHFPGAAVEVSQSHTGLHIIASARSVPAHGCKDGVYGFEMYHERRFIALTGINAIGNAATDCTAALPAVIDRYFKPGTGDTTAAPATWTTAPVSGYSSTETDDELIEHALRTTSAGSVFGGKASFADLWTRNVEALSKAYPDKHQDPPRPYDESTADMALAQHLSFWTGGNCERIQALMMRSGLVRDKWGRADYMSTTITIAVGRSKSFYSVHSTPPTSSDGSPADRGSGIDTTTGYQYMTTQAQIEHFKGCVYVVDQHKIFSLQWGMLLNQDRFNAVYGGYVFQIDDIGDKTTRVAWEAFMQSQVNRMPKVHTSCFRPALPSGEIFVSEGQSKVNVYVPVPVKMEAGDVAPFTELVRKMLPVERDRRILLSYMAACVQHIGVKFKWAPLIQGYVGNGKSTLSQCVSYAIGERYTHFPLASELTEKYNDWMFYKLFISVEDIKVHEGRKETLEILKPMITSERHAMRAMQCGQIMMDSCANWILNSNHKDAILSITKDRRYCPLFTAQQEKADLTKCGMTGAYFKKLRQWLDNGGYAHVAHYLKNYAIEEEFNPAGTCQTAPETSSSAEAEGLDIGPIEQMILEAVAEGQPGFCGGWISSIALERLLSQAGKSKSVPPNKRRDLLRSIGYDWHPALARTEGRVNNPILIDGNKKPRLFVKAGIAANVESPIDAVKLYIKAQEPASPLTSGLPGTAAAAATG